jgi:hypothetical protein
MVLGTVNDPNNVVLVKDEYRYEINVIQLGITSSRDIPKYFHHGIRSRNRGSDVVDVDSFVSGSTIL